MAIYVPTNICMLYVCDKHQHADPEIPGSNPIQEKLKDKNSICMYVHTSSSNPKLLFPDKFTLILNGVTLVRFINKYIIKCFIKFYLK